MTYPLVSIILAQHNGMDHIRACIDSIHQQSYENVEIILVDNASTDGTIGFVESNYPSVKIIRSDENLAFGPGNNLGVAHSSGELLLFLNHDTYVEPDFLVQLVHVFRKDPSIAVAQSRIMMAADPKLVDSAGAFLTRSGMWFHTGRGEEASDDWIEPFDVLGAAGACVLVRRSVFEALGGFDPDFRIYFDDADFSWRARLDGHRVVVVPGSVIYHWGGATTQSMPSKFTVFHSFKNRLCSLIKLLPTKDIITVVPVHLLICVIAAFGYLLRLKPSNSVAIVRAIRWNIENLDRTLEKRRTIAARIGSDPERTFEDFRVPLPLGWFMRTSLSYFSKW